MFERFTRDARKVVTSAVEEAGRRDDTRLGTEHLLIAVASSPALTGIFAAPEELRDQLDRLDQHALRSVGLDPALLDVTPPSRAGSRNKHLPFTGAAKDTLSGALKEAVALGHRHIGVEHIALALVTGTGPDRGRAILEGLDFSPDQLRASLLRHIERAS